jgi:hypothetical protein
MKALEMLKDLKVRWGKKLTLKEKLTTVAYRFLFPRRIFFLRVFY